MSWNKGDLAIVTGDRGMHYHQYPAGTEVKLIKANDGDYGTKGSWRCEATVADRKGNHQQWNVYDVDLEPVITEEDIQAAIESVKRRA